MSSFLSSSLTFSRLPKSSSLSCLLDFFKLAFKSENELELDEFNFELLLPSTSSSFSPVTFDLLLTFEEKSDQEPDDIIYA